MADEYVDIRRVSSGIPETPHPTKQQASIDVAMSVAGSAENWQSFCLWASANLPEGTTRKIETAVGNAHENPETARTLIQESYGHYQRATGRQT